MAEMSGRKFSTVAIVSTYCVTILGALALTTMKIMTVEVFIAMLSGFGGVVMYIVKAYFDDKDRSLQTTTNGGQPK